MKNTLFLLICFLASLPASPAFSQPSARIAGGPYLQNVTEDGFTVIWTTTTDAAAWVETAPDDGTHFYAVERPKYYDSHLGRRRLGKLHRVRVGGLEPGKTYRYRIMQQAVLSDEGNKRVVLGEGYGSDILKHAPYPVTTPSADRNELEFWMVNDIHGRDSVFRLLSTTARSRLKNSRPTRDKPFTSVPPRPIMNWKNATAWSWNKSFAPPESLTRK